MESPEIIDGYLMQSGLEYETVNEGMWIVHDDLDDIDNIVVRYAPPVVVFRVKLMDLPEAQADRAGLYEALLRLNANELVAGAYGLEGDSVILTETLQSENLDLNEFQAAIEGIALAIGDHYEQLKGFHQATNDGESSR
ncbi:MAG: YbjN domain-containing protein [Deltaproteobacteria bacterium]|nr:YbjN domain-containing protein [Deltaproteobacteria bacterium]MCB9788079.1 YbjN domain-containing protein [Deltaproteobacteria bacterium]